MSITTAVSALSPAASAREDLPVGSSRGLFTIPRWSFRRFRAENIAIILEGARRDESAISPFISVLQNVYGPQVADDIARWCRKTRFARPRKGFMPSRVYSSHLGSKYIPYLVWVVLQIPSTLAFQNAWVTFAGTPLFRGRYTAIHTKWRRLLRGLHYELIGLRARHSRVLRTAYPTAIVGLGLLTLSVVGQQNGGREIHELATVGVIGALSMLYLALALLFGGWLSRPKRLRADIEAFGHVCNVLSMGPYLLDARAYGMRRLTVVSLGNLAECLEQRLPRSLGMEDGAGDAEIRKRFSQMASRVREWQCHAALPTRGGHIEWLEHLAGVGAAIATQSLGEVVPWSSPVDEVVPRSGATATSIAGRVVGRALVGVTPGALYLVAKYGLRIELDTALEATWVPLSAGWAFTTLRSVFPDYKNRVGSTAQILGMLSPAKKGA